MGIFLTVIVIVFVVSIVVQLFYNIFVYAVKSLPYYLLCRKTGYNNSWLAFLPYGRDFIGFIIPKREYNMLILKTEKRQIPFWIWVALDFLLCLIAYAVPIVLMVIMFSEASGYTEMDNTAYNALSTISNIFGYGIAVVRVVVKAIFHWRKDYDLLKTYGMDNHAIWAPTVNIICPLVMYIFAFILLSYSPEYGEGGYYYNPDEDDDDGYYSEDCYSEE